MKLNRQGKSENKKYLDWEGRELFRINHGFAENEDTIAASSHQLPSHFALDGDKDLYVLELPNLAASNPDDQFVNLALL